MEFVYVVMFIKNEGGALELGSVHESKQSAKEWIFYAHRDCFWTQICSRRMMYAEVNSNEEGLV